MGKISASHLERQACVYVRQSSMAQVQHHRESTQRQYNFGERAMGLGWRAEQVEVIDEDQGRSGSSAVGRGGFQRLVAAVGLGVTATQLARFLRQEPLAWANVNQWRRQRGLRPLH